jgi:hypothetical protein
MRPAGSVPASNAERLSVRHELIEGLRRWLTECDDATIGDTSVYAGTPWLRFETSAGPTVVHADTTRQAVKRMIAASRVEARWWVIANTRGASTRLPSTRNEADRRR